MPYSAEHKQKSKNKLLASAFELFAHNGYENVTIDNITQHAGLTRGAFYNHFSSKQALYSESMKYAAENSNIMRQLETAPHNAETLIKLINGYLSQEHLTNIQPCPLAFLVTDVANQEPHVRDTYTYIFEGISKKMVQLMNHGGTARQKRETSQALATLLIGGVAVGRSLSDDKLSNQVMKACRILANAIVKGNPSL